MVTHKEEQMITCPKCHGKGKYLHWTYTGEGYADKIIELDCEVCNKTGKITLDFYEELQKGARGEKKC